MQSLVKLIRRMSPSLSGIQPTIFFRSRRDRSTSNIALPRLLDTNDARNITIPHIILASPDEPKEVIAEYKAILEGKAGIGCEVDTYGTMFHGWMGARANLEDEQNKKEFERG